MSEATLPDAEGVIRTYLRSVSGVTALLGQRIFFGVDDPSTYPIAIIQRIGGGLDSTEGLSGTALIQLDIYGNVHDKASAYAALSACVNALNDVRNYSTATTRLLGVNVQSFAWLPDESERARYSVTMQAFVAPV